MKTAVWIRKLSWSIPAAAVLLMALGWLALARYEDLTDSGGHFLRQQMVWSVVGVGVMFGVTIPSYRLVCRWSYAIFGVSLLLLVAVYFFPSINGAHRWIRLGPVGLQPSEFAKVAFVLAMARYLMHDDNTRRLLGLVPPLVLTTVPVLLVLKEPDLGTSSVFLPVLFFMLFVAGARRRDLMAIVLAGLVLLPLLWTQMSHEQKSRVTALFDQPAADQRPSSDAYQLYQAKRMMALGGVGGSLLAGQPTEDSTAYRLPEARTDFIFCVLGERLGLPGLALVLAAYGLLVGRGLAVAAVTREPFGRLLAAGISGLVAVQVLVNTGMTVGLLPVTGLPLPLVSYGGSGLVSHCLALGLLVNVALRPGYEMTGEPFRYVAA